jgi:arylsulfatase A-like enzyme
VDYLKNTGDLCLSKSEFSDQLFSKDFNVAFQGESTYLIGDPLPSSAFFSWLHKARQIVNERFLNKDYGYLFPRGIPSQNSLFFVLEDAIDWIADQITSFPNPFLSYIHLLPPHEPYTTRHDFIDIFKDGWNPIAKEPNFFSEGKSQEYLNQKHREYDEYIAYTDAEFGRLLGYLESTELLDNTYVIFTSDHGELFERGIQGHSTQTLYEPLIRVPLLIFKPHQQVRQDIHTPTSFVDLLPTLLDITGQPIPDWCEGSILPTFDEQDISTDRPIFALEAKSNSKYAPLTNATFAIIRDEHKLIHYLGYDAYESQYELYDLLNDPDELTNMYDSRKIVAASLQQELEEKLNEVNKAYN